MSIRVTNNCQNKEESYNEICVYCNKCYRFSNSVDKCEEERIQETIEFVEWIRNEKTENLIK